MDNNALLSEFLVESFENLNSINNDLTKIEKNPDDKELLNKIYRTVHTMKGSASFLGYKVLQELTHCAENLLDELRENKILLNSTIVDVLFQTFDLSNDILKNLESSGEEGNVNTKENVQALEQLLHPLGKQESNTIQNDNALSPALSEDPELESLIRTHKEVITDASSKEATASVETEGVSSAALDSLKELVGEGKMDAHILDEFSESKDVNNDTNEEEQLSSAALESLKELVGEGKVDASLLDEFSESKDVNNEANEEEQLSSAALESLKELVGEGKVDATTTQTQSKMPSENEGKTSIADSFVRVNVKILDKIMNIVGELVLNRNQIIQYSNHNPDQELNRLSQQLSVITSELQSQVMSTRMQQIGSILTKFERLVRDFSRTSGKKVKLKLSGEGTELDKTLIEAIKDPLVHIIRNACDHGIESVEERETSNKPADGTIHIKSYNESGQVIIEIVDDGRGLDPNKIAAKAIEKGIINQDELEQLSENQILMLIFAPGFSTAGKITNISGRGVGMDVVRTNIEKIGGSVTICSELGKGTTFKLRIPLTLAIVPALIIKSSEQSFAIPQLNLVELVRLETDAEKAQIEKVQEYEFLKLRGRLTPVFNLDQNLLLEQVKQNDMAMQELTGDCVGREKIESKNIIQNIDDAINIVILQAEDTVFGIIVNSILDTEEIVVKPLNSGLKHLGLFGGATIMGDGKVALILDALGFLNTVSANRSKVMDASQGPSNLAEEEINIGKDFQENLLFTLYDDREYAVPLSLVSRLEEFNFSQIEMTGDQPIVRYSDAPMPLINLEKSLHLKAKSILDIVDSKKEGTISCIVTTIRGKNYGIIVKKVLDISIDNTAIDGTAVDREGILGTVFINEKTVSLIDLYKIIESQNLGGKGEVRPVIEGAAKNKKILIVDDSPMYRKIEADLLSKAGYKVETASNGEEGFIKFGQGGYDLILTDIEMPKLTGYELASKIRTELKNQDIPIVALSTRVSENDQLKGRESGFNYHLEKLKNDEVIDVINNILVGK